MAARNYEKKWIDKRNETARITDNNAWLIWA